MVLTKSRLKVLSGFFGNISAGWFAVIFLVQNYSDLTRIEDVIILVSDILVCILSLLIAFWLEEEAGSKI